MDKDAAAVLVSLAAAVLCAYALYEAFTHLLVWGLTQHGPKAPHI
jgi:hypothetical protein